MGRRAWLALVATMACAVWLLSLPSASRSLTELPLPASLAAPSPDAAPPDAVQTDLGNPPAFVSVVAADIDADGDLDVVAASASLELFVWTNDGSGHLTRQAPTRSAGWRSAPRPPDVGTDSPISTVFVQNDAPSAGSVLAAHPTVLEPSCWTCGQAVRSTHRWRLATRSPRAPPTALSLT
jgi:hypothetical protein